MYYTPVPLLSSLPLLFLSTSLLPLYMLSPSSFFSPCSLYSISLLSLIILPLPYVFLLSVPSIPVLSFFTCLFSMFPLSLLISVSSLPPLYSMVVTYISPTSLLCISSMLIPYLFCLLSSLSLLSPPLCNTSLLSISLLLLLYFISITYILPLSNYINPLLFLTILCYLRYPVSLLYSFFIPFFFPHSYFYMLYLISLFLLNPLLS